MAKVTEDREQYYRSRIRDLMVIHPNIPFTEIQRKLESSETDSLRLGLEYIKKQVRKIKKERLVKVDRADIKERIAVMRETMEAVQAQMWTILMDTSLNYEKGGIGARVTAGKVIVESQRSLLEAEMNAGVFDRKLGSVELAAAGTIEHLHRLDPGIKAPIMQALQNYGLIKPPEYTVIEPEPVPDTVGAGTVPSV